MQYSVPQFVEIEDKIIGPLTLKQFLILVFGGLVTFFFWGLFKTSIIFFVFALPTIGFFGLLAFGRYNGRPLLSNIGGLTKFYLTPKVRIFKRTGEKSFIIKKTLPIEEKKKETAQAKESRLKRLAYLLDQKTAEEERLIHSGKLPKQWLNQL